MFDIDITELESYKLGYKEGYEIGYKKGYREGVHIVYKETITGLKEQIKSISIDLVLLLLENVFEVSNKEISLVNDALNKIEDITLLEKIIDKIFETDDYSKILEIISLDSYQ